MKESCNPKEVGKLTSKNQRNLVERMAGPSWGYGSAGYMFWVSVTELLAQMAS